jgi:tetratricopeptide (TPR) repeat protein
VLGWAVGLVLVSISVVFLFLVFGIVRLGSGPSAPLSRASLAYERGAWEEAARFARLGLKEDPDDVAAIRILARSMARMGRDGPANALFARLGEDGLQAEDRYLLGLGLERGGRGPSAVKVWEVGLAEDANNPELLDVLIRAYTAQNRLAEATALARRIEKVRGRELGGSLNLGTLLYERNDVAGAARALSRALTRTDAATLDPDRRQSYQRLLARALLRLGQPADAKAALGGANETELESTPGRDPELAWLLSRVALQENRIDTVKRLEEAATSYRETHALEAEPAPYVGEVRCANCHREQAEACRRSRHASTCLRGDDLLNLPYPEGPVVDPDDSKVLHSLSINRPARTVEAETRVEDRVFRAIVDYAIGSVDRYVSLIGHDADGRSRILRLSRFQNGGQSGWVRTTGHSADAQGGEEYDGKRLDAADGVEKCLFCHTTNARAVLQREGPESLDRAIGCERCHGPGGNHTRAVAASLQDPAIISPATADVEARMRLCGQCHALHQSLPLAKEDPFWVRFPNTTLPWSRCYLESQGRMDCMTCHNPHHDADPSPAAREAICLSCHGGDRSGAVGVSTSQVGSPPRRPARGGAIEARSCPVDASQGCLTCHMPNVRSEPLHIEFTDHYIRVLPEKRPKPQSDPRSSAD